MIVVSKKHNNTSSRRGSRRCMCIYMSLCVCVCVCVVWCLCVCERERVSECVSVRDNVFVRRWLCGARMRLSPSTKRLFEAHSTRHSIRRRRRCLWRWWREGRMVRIWYLHGGRGSIRSAEDANRHPEHAQRKLRHLRCRKRKRWLVTLRK